MQLLFESQGKRVSVTHIECIKWLTLESISMGGCHGHGSKLKTRYRGFLYVQKNKELCWRCVELLLALFFPHTTLDEMVSTLHIFA